MSDREKLISAFQSLIDNGAPASVMADTAEFYHQSKVAERNKVVDDLFDVDGFRIIEDFGSDTIDNK